MANTPPAAEPSTPAPAAGGSAEQIAQGDKIFHGQEAGGTCTACHGQDAKGTQMAPDLTDGQWLMGGASLTPDQVKAVAAYVYSLSHKGGGRPGSCHAGRPVSCRAPGVMPGARLPG